MNAKGLIVGLDSAAQALGWGFVQKLVTDGSVSQGELDATRKGLSAASAALKKTPSEKIDAMVAEYDDELTSYFGKFQAGWQQDPLGGFRNVQVMEGYVTTILAKSGIRG